MTIKEHRCHGMYYTECNCEVKFEDVIVDKLNYIHFAIQEGLNNNKVELEQALAVVEDLRELYENKEIKLDDKPKCPNCSYTPILNWFNYCPMCVYALRELDIKSRD